VDRAKLKIHGRQNVDFRGTAVDGAGEIELAVSPRDQLDGTIRAHGFPA
jgi:hypothetical protein